VSISFKSPVEIALLKGLAIKTSLVKCSVLNFWVKNGPDGTGGFHATLNRAGNPIAPTGGCTRFNILSLTPTQYVCTQAEAPRQHPSS
jgi:hypothetical protein